MRKNISRTMHMSLSVRGALRKSDKELQSWCGSMVQDGKKLTTVEAIRDCLMQALSEGYEYLPMEECDNFDPKRGCLGHVKEEQN